MSRVNRFEYTDWKGFGRRTKKYRKQINLTKEKFAEIINRSDNFVSELEKGNVGCSIHTLHQISKVLKVSTDSILYGEEKEEKQDYTDKEILKEIINRCNKEELAVIREIIVALFPNLDTVVKERK